jgi:hypothetical protein
MLKHGIRIAGKSHQVEIYVHEGLDSQCHLCNEWGHTQNTVPKHNQHVESVPRNRLYQHTYIGLVDAHPNEG